jgi:hypothetical protein
MVRGMPILHKSNVLLSKQEIPHPSAEWVAVDEFEDLFQLFGNSRAVTVTRRRARDSLDRFHLGVEPQAPGYPPLPRASSQVDGLSHSLPVAWWLESGLLGGWPIRRKYLMTSLD